MWIALEIWLIFFKTWLSILGAETLSAPPNRMMGTEGATQATTNYLIKFGKFILNQLF